MPLKNLHKYIRRKIGKHSNGLNTFSWICRNFFFKWLVFSSTKRYSVIGDAKLTGCLPCVSLWWIGHLPRLDHAFCPLAANTGSIHLATLRRTNWVEMDEWQAHYQTGTLAFSSLSGIIGCFGNILYKKKVFGDIALGF